MFAGRLGTRTHGGRRLQRAGGRRVAIDLGVALVDGEDKVMGDGGLEQRRQGVEAGCRALRIGRGTQVDQRRLLQCLRPQRAEIRQKAALGGGGNENRLGAGHHRGARIDVVERVGHQHQRAPGAGCGFRHRGEGEHEQRLTGAGHRQDIFVGVDIAGRQAVARSQPVGHGVAEAGGAAQRRIVPPLLGVMGQGRGDEIGRRVARLAERQGDRLDVAGGRDAVEHGVQPLERIGNQIVKARVQHDGPKGTPDIEISNTHTTNYGKFRRIIGRPPCPGAR